MEVKGSLPQTNSKTLTFKPLKVESKLVIDEDNPEEQLLDYLQFRINESTNP